MRRSLRPSRTTSPPLDPRVLQFILRADQVQLHGQRNYSRWKLLTKGFVAADSFERLQWQRESPEESQRDVAWNQRHGPVPSGASILTWRDEHEDSPRASASNRR
jgi:hypothetical protein